MRRTVRAVLIPDVLEAPCEVVQLPEDDLARWSMTIGCTYVEILPCWQRDAQLAVDDTGLLTRRPFNRRASLVTFGRYLVGPALVFGLQPAGDTADVPMPLEIALTTSSSEQQLVEHLYPGGWQ